MGTVRKCHVLKAVVRDGGREERSAEWKAGQIRIPDGSVDQHIFSMHKFNF